MLTSCGRDEVVEKAKNDFSARHPSWKITGAHLGEGDGGTAYVVVSYIEPARVSVYPSKATPRRMEMGYAHEDGAWRLFSESGPMGAKSPK